MKKRAIRAELRKESKTFPGYFKYELDVQFGDGTIEKNIPAYGKDLQDALSRTVKKQKVEKMEKKLSNIPDWVMLMSWFLYLGGIALGATLTDNLDWLVGGLLFPFVAFLGVNLWSLYKSEKP